MTSKIFYEVSIGEMYSGNIRFNTYEDAKAEYDDLKTYTRDSFVGLTKITIETLESEFIKCDDQEKEEWDIKSLTHH